MFHGVIQKTKVAQFCEIWYLLSIYQYLIDQHRIHKKTHSLNITFGHT